MVKSVVPAVDRASVIVGALASHPEGLTFAELLQCTGIARSTLHNLIQALEANQWVRHAEGGARYTLGLALVRWGAVAVGQLDLRTVARPVLTALAQELGETCHMGVMDWQDMKVAYIDKIGSPRAIPVRSQVGSHMDAHSTALGKVLLAHATLNDQMRFLRREPLAAHTPHTITDTDRLFREFVHVRSVGFAVDRGENEGGILCVAAPVRDFRGAVIAAVSTTGPMDVSAEYLDRKVELTHQAARQISHAMGAPEDERRRAPDAAGELEAAGVGPWDPVKR